MFFKTIFVRPSVPGGPAGSVRPYMWRSVCPEELLRDLSGEPSCGQIVPQTFAYSSELTTARGKYVHERAWAFVKLNLRVMSLTMKWPRSRNPPQETSNGALALLIYIFLPRHWSSISGLLVCVSHHAPCVIAWIDHVRNWCLGGCPTRANLWNVWIAKPTDPEQTSRPPETAGPYTLV